MKKLTLFLVSVQLPPNFAVGFPLEVFTATTASSFFIFLHTAPGTPMSVTMLSTRACELELELQVPLDLVEEEVSWQVSEFANFSRVKIIFGFSCDVDRGGVSTKLNGDGTCKLEFKKLKSKHLLQLTIK